MTCQMCQVSEERAHQVRQGGADVSGPECAEQPHYGSALAHLPVLGNTHGITRLRGAFSVCCVSLGFPGLLDHHISLNWCP